MAYVCRFVVCKKMSAKTYTQAEQGEACVGKLHAKEYRKVRAFDESIVPKLIAFAETGTKLGAAEKLSVDRGNLSKEIDRFLADWPVMSDVVDKVRSRELVKRSSLSEIGQKVREGKIERAEKGFLMIQLLGYDNDDGVPHENEKLKRIKGVLDGFRKEYKGETELARESGFSKSAIRHVLKNPGYKGEYPYYGKMYKITQGGFKPLLTPDEWDEIQSMLHTPRGRYRLSRILYNWGGRSGKWMAKPGAKKITKAIVRLRKNKKSLQVIMEALMKMGFKVGTETIRKILRDMRITGKMFDKDGNLVDSGFEELVPLKDWEAARRVKVPDVTKIKRDRGTKYRKTMLRIVPACRWEIIEIMGLSRGFVEFLVKDLKKSGALEERAGFLQSSSKSFPKTTLSTPSKARSQRRAKMLSLLLESEKSREELRLRANIINKNTFASELFELQKTGVIERVGYNRYKIKDGWVKRVKKWLSQDHIAKL